MNKTIIYWDAAKSQFGNHLIAHTQKGICAIMPAREQDGLFDKIFPSGPDGPFEHQLVYSSQYAQKIAKQIDGGDTSDIELDILIGTDFQRKVWAALLTIPKGETRTYSQIAEQIGSPKAVRAVGSAVGVNPISILIPCHRVVPKNGSIGNYRWGSKMKKALLNYEGLYNQDKCVGCEIETSSPYPTQYNDKELPVCNKCYDGICMYNMYN